MALTNTEKSLKDKMKTLGVWKSEYIQTVRICADLMDQYDTLNEDYKQNVACQLKYTDKKPPIVGTLESLRKDILAYMKELGLTPAAIKKLDAMTNMPESNVLADALRKLGG